MGKGLYAHSPYSCNKAIQNCKNHEKSILTGKRWFPYMKGGGFVKWYGLRHLLINWHNDGEEIRATGRATLRNQNYYFLDGVTWSSLSTKGFAVRWMEPGFLFDDKGSCGFPISCSKYDLIAILNSSFTGFALSLLNPSISFQSGDLSRIPFVNSNDAQKQVLEILVSQAIWRAKLRSNQEETSLDFVAPILWVGGLQELTEAQLDLQQLESQIDDEVFAMYGISSTDRAAIEAELAGGGMSEDEEETKEGKTEEEGKEDTPQSMNPAELAVRWISYAVSVVSGRFQPGIAGSLGSAIYRRSDFAIGSLPAPDEAEFDELVGPVEKFAYVDENGGRHVFPARVEKALQSLALSDGIAVFDEGHPRDLPTLVEKALNLMLGEGAAREVIRDATGEDSSTSLSASLRKFLEKDFFTGWHVKWYRKRPVYWPIQSSKRSYGFVLFHKKITRDTFYAIQREPYLDTKRNAVALKMADLQASLARATGTARKKLEKELDDLRKLSDELAEFAKELEAITLGGYEPEPDWIDDGVILRMAPLWKVLPIWKSEPKKYWERCEAGDFDWSRIAMRYWPERVREKCKTNKSYAIAHGHEEWFEG